MSLLPNSANGQLLFVRAEIQLEAFRPISDAFRHTLGESIGNVLFVIPRRVAATILGCE